MAWNIYHGDCREVMAKLDAESVDSIVSDPPYGLSFMGKGWDHGVPGVEFWVEALRVAKPGAHLLAFGGTRTYHRLACAIEDAGWEIRDCVMWVYGSGFPKSHDVSKAIDKAAGAEREVVGLDHEWIRRVGQNHGKSGTYTDKCHGSVGPNGGKITAPATDAARQWQGWGTALKPAWEPIIVARKPLASAGVNVLKLVEYQLRERGVTGDIRWKPESASGAGRKKSRTCSSSTDQPQAVETSAESAGENVTQSTGRRTRKSSRRRWTSGTPKTPEGNESFQGGTTDACGNVSSPPTAESASVAEKLSPAFLPSTTSTAAEHNTESSVMERSTPTFAATDSRPDTESFAGIATGLTGSMATVHISRASGGVFLWPMGLPEFVPGSPVTVAENVLKHGTGGINVDGCRVGTSDRPAGSGRSLGYHGNGRGTGGNVTPVSGRWPANVIHDGSDEVVGLFPNVKTGNIRPYAAKSKAEYRQLHCDQITGSHVGDSGSAARFFYCAKASKADRDADNKHPTVKPTALMRYLCRLVTPPGGLVLDPFTGSGSTGKAAILEGFRFIGIEREAEYVEIAKARIGAAEAGAGPLFAQK